MFEKLQTGEKSMMHQDSLEPAAIRFTLFKKGFPNLETPLDLPL